MKRLLCCICLGLILSGCSGSPTYEEALSITNTETGDVVSIGDSMDNVDSVVGTPQFYPNTNAYLYGDSALPIGNFAAYYDHGNVCCLIVGPEENSKWEMYGNIKLGDSSKQLGNAFDVQYKNVETGDRHFAAYMFDGKYKTVDSSTLADYFLLFSLDDNDNILAVMLATADYLSESIDLSTFD